MKKQEQGLGVFEKYLTVWVLLCIVAGIAIGNFFGDSMLALSRLELSNVNIPIAILIWLMIYPMMLQIDFNSLKISETSPRDSFSH